MQIFLSYTSMNVDAASKVRDYLSQEGHTVLEQYRASGEENTRWMEELIDAELVIALFSPRYAKSQRVMGHLTVVQRLEKAFIPLLVEGTEQTAIPFGFENYDVIDARDNLEKWLKHLLTLINEIKPSANRRAAQTPPKTIEPNTVIHKVFIAYSRKQRQIAKDLYDLLKGMGQLVFYDAKLRAGANWRQMIQRALDDCTHLIVIWTPDAAESDEVEREVSYALAERKVIIPILSQEIPKLPYHLNGLHYVVLQDDLKTLEQDLVTAIAQFADDDDLYK